MPRYFFHLHNNHDVPDPEGRLLPDPDRARDVARAEARYLAAESIREGQLDLTHYILVTDEAGAVVQLVTFGDVLTIRSAADGERDGRRER